MSRGRAITLLHLSDLHFGRHHRFDMDNGLGSLLDRLRVDLDERRDRDGLRPDLVVLSGDFSEHGKKDELDRALRFVQGLARLLELPARRVVMVPGNHDINWPKCRAYFEDCEGDEVAPVEPYARKLVFYKQLFDQFYEGELDISFTEDEPWSFFEYPDLGVVVAGLNSVIAESHREADHYGFVGEKQLRAFVEKLRPYKEQGYLRIGVMHHDPFERKTPRAEQDFKDISRLLRPWVNLVLHGDVHEERLQWLYSNVAVFGAGSAAVGVDQRAPEVPNEYQILQMSRTGVRWGLRAYVPDQKRWVGSVRRDEAGEQWLQDLSIAFERVETLGEAGGPAPAVDLARLVESYRQAIARDQRTPTVFDLIGVNEIGESAGGLDFLRVFVPQHAVRAVLHRNERREVLRERALVPGDQEELEGARHSEPDKAFSTEALFARAARTVDELLGSGIAPWLLLLGAPGAGKTALTRWLLLKLCLPGEAVAGLPEHLVPMRIEMRRFDEAYRRAGSGYSFLDHLDCVHAERSLNLRGEPLRELAGAGRLFWIFDGLDEVVDGNRRRHYAEMIGGLAKQYPDCRGLVTSRFAGAEIARPALEAAGFITHELEDFADNQRDRFLDAWHALVFARDPGVGEHRRTRMAHAIESIPSVRELCKTPLLCALLAYINREEDLPQRRHRLYQKILERMAEHWDANKALPPRPAAERFDLDSKLLFLRRLAWEMLQDAVLAAGNAIEYGALEDFAARFCEQHWNEAPHVARRTAEVLIRELRERNYVLAFFGGTTYGFAHRTFLEYLAALEAYERFRERRWELDDLGKLFAAHWREAVWEETLLLLCGFLQDANPDFVVRMLQSIPGKDRAIVYESLKDYLAFCIKALGELSQLDRGVPFEFARGINDILERQMRDDFMDPWRLDDAFRRCAGRWPQLDRLVAVTNELIGDKPHKWVGLFYECWIAAAGMEQRLRILLLFEALKRSEVILYALAFRANSLREEAAKFGHWSANEISQLCEVAATREPLEKLDILAMVVLTPRMAWRTNDLPILALHDLMHRCPDWDIRQRSAWTLLRAGCLVEDALNVLRNALQSLEGSVVRQAALDLAEAGYAVDEVIDILEKHAPEHGDCMVRLLELSRNNEVARRALRNAVTQLREKSEPSTFVDVVRAAAEYGVLLVSPEEIRDRLHRIDDVGVRLSWMSRMARVPSLCPLLVDEYKLLYRATPSVINSRRHGIMSMDLRYAGPALIELWSELLASGEPTTSISTAGDILRSKLHDVDLRTRAHQHLLSFLSEKDPEDVRLLAARNLGLGDPAGREAHRVLARTAQDAGNRITAARTVGDIDALNHLVNNAEEAHWSNRARHVIELYGHIDSLLHIGQPRRARVLLHGRDVGILEETSAAGGTRFTYASDYIDTPGARPIAPHMPLRREPYESDTLHPFFANLLPEGHLYDATARRLGLKRTDRFGMLLHVGGDVMGAVQVLPEQDP